MDHPLLVLIAGHLGAFALAVVAGGLTGSPMAHRLLFGRLCAVGAAYLACACAWADWVLLGQAGVVAAFAIPGLGAALAWAVAAVHRRWAPCPMRGVRRDVNGSERLGDRGMAVRVS